MDELEVEYGGNIATPFSSPAYLASAGFKDNRMSNTNSSTPASSSTATLADAGEK